MPQPSDDTDELEAFAELLGKYRDALIAQGFKRSEAVALVGEYQLLYWGQSGPELEPGQPVPPDPTELVP